MQAGVEGERGSPEGPITPATVVVTAGGQVSADLDGEVLVFQRASEEFHLLEGVGATVWRLLQRPVQVAAVRDALLARYPVEANRCEADLIELLEGLRERGLLESRGE